MEGDEEKEVSSSSGHDGSRLPTRMPESWASKHLWFDFAACDTSAVDSVYWEILRRVDSGFAPPPEKEAEMERSVHGVH